MKKCKIFQKKRMKKDVHIRLYDNIAQKHGGASCVKCIKKSKKEGLCGIGLDE